MKDLTEKKIFGNVIAYVWVVGFQKRGLPHCHILLCLENKDKISSIEQVDLIVNAEIPNKDKYPKAYETVTKCLIHGPCGPAFPDASCMKEGKCSKKFSKEFSTETQLNSAQ